MRPVSTAYSGQLAIAPKVILTMRIGISLGSEVMPNKQTGELMLLFGVSFDDGEVKLVLQH